MAQPQNEPIDGEVFLERKIVELNEGGKTKKTVLEHYFLCTIWPDNRIEMHLLDLYDEISDVSEVVDRAEFKSRFFLQPGYMSEKTTREERLKQNLINRLCDLADTHYKAREYHSAEYEFNRAIRLDENSVRANFGLGLTYIAQGDDSQARALFTKLANLDAVYEEGHEHLFNSFGIQLRKLGMFHQAMEHYNRALQIVQDDEHLWFNLGRCLHEDGKEPAARKMIIKALQLSPDFLEAQYFLQVYLKTPIPADVKSRIKRAKKPARQPEPRAEEPEMEEDEELVLNLGI